MFQELNPRFQITAAPTFGNLPTAHTWYDSFRSPPKSSKIIDLISPSFPVSTNFACPTTKATSSLRRHSCLPSARAPKVLAWSNWWTRGLQKSCSTPETGTAIIRFLLGAKYSPMQLCCVLPPCFSIYHSLLLIILLHSFTVLYPFSEQSFRSSRFDNNPIRFCAKFVLLVAFTRWSDSALRPSLPFGEIGMGEVLEKDTRDTPG